MKRKNRPKQIDSAPPATRLPRKPRTETINDTTYILREHWWFQQYPVNDEITLELCVGYGVEWIEGLKPKPKDRLSEYKESIIKAEKWFAGDGPYVVSNITKKLNRLNSQIQAVNDKSEQLDRLNEICNVQRMRDLELAKAQCCCTTNTDKSIYQMQLDSVSNSLNADDLRQQIIEQQMAARNAELFNRMVAVGPLPYYPAHLAMQGPTFATEQDYLAWKGMAK